MEDEAAGGTTAAESDGPEKDEDERELDKLEKNDPEMLRICTVILDQLEKFKVRLCVKWTKLRVFRVFVFLTFFFSLLLTLHWLYIMCVPTRSAQSCRTRRDPAANGKLWRSSFWIA